jgi:hypothetical protein
MPRPMGIMRRRGEGSYKGVGDVTVPPTTLIYTPIDYSQAPFNIDYSSSVNAASMAQAAGLPTSTLGFASSWVQNNWMMLALGGLVALVVLPHLGGRR